MMDPSKTVCGDNAMVEKESGCNTTSKIPEWLLKRDMERQQEIDRKKQERESQAVKEEKSSFFNSNFYTEKSSIDAMLQSCCSIPKADLPMHFEAMTVKLQQLQKFLNDSVMFLPSYDLRQAQDALQNLQDAMIEKRDELMPKKKFAFKVRKKEVSVPKEKSVLECIDGPKDKAMAPTMSVCGFSNVASQNLVKFSDDVNSKDVLLSNLSDCTVKLFGAPSTLHIKNVINSKILCGPVATSVFVDECKDCVFVLACQQLRTHSTKDTSVYLHVTSRAIIEDCSDIRFAPYSWWYEGLEKDFATAGLQRNTNNWNCVDDFNWLSLEAHSPNWSVIPDVERIKAWDS
ncbi:tubulin-specific chaperone C [Protopterus annectens]|uniref:tubulin-specific chaperone C n=1 Tax=Protopterus annectens TaxID=7888 RepID=UPI001CFC08BA|nr:tubulin-specific chaperone C [Protopterus annectens]